MDESTQTQLKLERKQRKERNQLHGKHLVVLLDWLKTNIESLQGVHLLEIAKRAESAVGVPVTKYNISFALECLDLRVKPVRVPRPKVAPAADDNTVLTRLALLERQVHTLALAYASIVRDLDLPCVHEVENILRH